MTRARRLLLIAGALALAVIVTGCAPVQTQVPGAPGFFDGLWDGLTAIFAFFGNLLGLGDWGIYEPVNSGGWYDFGFLVGIGAFAAGGTSAAR